MLRIVLWSVTLPRDGGPWHGCLQGYDFGSSVSQMTVSR
jgi:hypothetical protein